MSGVDQFVDPQISLSKFSSEATDYLRLRREYEKRGWFLIEHQFPTFFMILASTKVQPPAVVYGLLFDYTNYDARPPSVRFVNPFTREPYRYKEIPQQLRLNRAVPGGPVALPGMPGQIQFGIQQPLLQAFDDEEVPFLCIAGVREYHEQEAHSGDAWELHRSSGAGRLVRLLEVISQYGLDPVRGYGVNLIPQVGFDVGPPAV